MRPLVLVLATLVAPATACSILVGAAYEGSLWHRLTDFQAPTAPVVTAGPLDLRRGIGPRVLSDSLVSSTSCDDLGVLRIELRASSDGRTRRDQIGYEVVVVGGEAPRGLIPDRPRTLARLDREPVELSLVWIDGATDAQEAVDVSVVIRALDRAGNRSAPSDTVRIAHPGYASGVPRRDASGARL